jgi:hypothetical protein
VVCLLFCFVCVIVQAIDADIVDAHEQMNFPEFLEAIAALAVRCLHVSNTLVSRKFFVGLFIIPFGR